MMLVEDRMNKLEHNMMNKQNQTPNEDVFWESVKDKVQNDTEYRDTDGCDGELEKQYWAEQIPKPSITPKNGKEMMITKPDDFYGKIDFDDELEQQFWKEQPPYPFATDEEVEQLKKEGKL